jgi:transcriptional regulator with XRE-family HTH domain
MLSAKIGAALQRARKAKRISRAELAVTGGVSVRLIAELERGDRPNVSLETALQLLDAVGVSLRPAGAVTAADQKAAETVAFRQRAAVRRATWVGAVTTFADSDTPLPPASVPARLAAVASASALVHAIARANTQASSQRERGMQGEPPVARSRAARKRAR